MRVLHIITRLIGGGAQMNTLRTACLHRQAGIDVELLYGATDASREGALIDEARAIGLPLRHLPTLVREPSFRDDASALLSLVHLLRTEPYDVVHTHTSKAGFLGRLAARLAGGVVVVHTPHGHVFHSYYGPLTTRMYVMLERVAAGWTDRMVALTPRERDEHLDYGIGTREAFAVVPSGIRIHHWRGARTQREAMRLELGAGRDDLLIGAVGRLAQVKGHDVLVRAFATLAASNAHARLVLVGDGAERERLVGLTGSLGIASRVTFLGRLDDPAPIVGALDVFAVPSLNEGMGRVVLEAMAAGVPVVASAIGGIPDLIEDGLTGLLVPPGDAPALARALASTLRAHDESQDRAARAAHHIGPSYGEQAMAERLLRLYSDLLGTTSRRGPRSAIDAATLP